MPASGPSTEKISLTFRAEAPAAPRGSLPGGWWIWSLLGIGIGIGGWLVSRHYLAERLGAQLLTARSRGEAVTAIEGLILLDATGRSGIVAGLQNEDFYVARTAFRTLDSQITRWQQLTATEFATRIRRLAESLSELPTSTPPDNLILASSLASRIFTICLENDDVALRDVIQLCEQVVQRAGQGQARDVGTVSGPQLLPAVESTDTDEFTALKTPPPPLPSEVAAPITLSLSGEVPVEASLSLRDDIEPPSTTNSGTPSQLAFSTGEARASLRLIHSPLRSKVQLSDSFEATTFDSADAARTPTAASSSRALDAQTAVTLSGMDQLPIKELVRLLASVQPKISQAAAIGLRRHGMSDDKLELAMQLATGTEQRRLELIEQLSSRTDLDPRVWLLWMAQDGETAVRARSVAELNSMLDLDVMRELRQQLNRERDPQVAHLIRQVLMTP